MSGRIEEVPNLRSLGNGVWTTPGARIIDRSGERRLPIGEEGFLNALARSTVVDKTMLIADVLDSNFKCTLFCRPRRFGKTFNMTMLKAFFDIDGEDSPTVHWEVGGVGGAHIPCGQYDDEPAGGSSLSLGADSNVGGASGAEENNPFIGTEVWEAANGRYRSAYHAYPVVHISFNTVKRLTWESALG